MSRLRLLLTVVMMPACATPGSGAGTQHAPRLPEPDYLLPLARKVLHERMERHGRDMPQLLLSVVLLQRDVAASTAARIANEPRVSRPPPADDFALNRALPERFFVLQEDLRQRAKAVAELTQTCVACHSAYLNP
ncbi:MAG: hypothetical protein K1X64_23150 [Myxococcaceae bacterium]|nr:hypothetical protein [Myxococcaceae bacterium]